jgi:ATP-dependent DNA helicase RecQ
MNDQRVAIAPSLAAEVKQAIARYWGITSLRPLQQPAIEAVLAGRDSLVVLPTGGGKSLCYQAPALVQSSTTIVVSPLISLMKDQVDGLRSAGVNAVQLDSSQTPEQRLAYERQVRNGAVRLLFVSPERLVQSDLYLLLQSIQVQAFAVDEAHCISHWGHDFRPEYRQLRRLRELFPAASIHAYTATATEVVRKDIIDQLGLRDPVVLTGNFDRPNLTYRVVSRRGDLISQIIDVIGRHSGEGGIIYCIRRADVDAITAALAARGVKAMPYHAGLTAEQRTETQDAFTDERCDIVVATVAFGMGIDRSNVRYVLHTAMAKSIEHYQQETGRAGRDGLEAECVLLHSGADFFAWKSIIERAVSDQPAHSSRVESALKHLNDMDRYCRSAVCRHRLLAQYFGQSYAQDNCGACDICLGETVTVADGTVIAQKILSCVARVKQRFGIGHVVSVLRGENSEAIRQRGHHELSTHGLLRGHSHHDLRDWIYQLISHGVLEQVEVENSSGRSLPVLRLNQSSLEVMRNERAVRLLQPVQRKKGEQAGRSKADAASWDGVDATLFEALRKLRRDLAHERRVPPYVIFNDATLREFARVRPSTLTAMRRISGVGDTKLGDFGNVFLNLIVEECRRRKIPMDQG